MEKKFRVLRIVATIYKIIGWVVLVLGVLGGCGTVVFGLLGGASAGPRGSVPELAAFGLFGGILSGLVIIFFAVLYFVFLYAFGEMIYLLLALEENTRLTAERLQSMTKS